MEEIHALLRAEPMRPTFTIVFGCDGAGKTIWSRQHRTRLPERFFDVETLAEGVGGWGRPGPRRRAEEFVANLVDQAFATRQDFGVESAGPVLVERAIAAGYRVEGVYLGMTSPTINVERIWRRVGGYPTGHVVDDLEGLPGRHQHSLRDLQQVLPVFDRLVLEDNSPDRTPGIPAGVPAVVLERGRPVFEARVLAPWVAATLRLHGD